MCASKAAKRNRLVASVGKGYIYIFDNFLDRVFQHEISGEDCLDIHDFLCFCSKKKEKREKNRLQTEFV